MNKEQLSKILSQYKSAVIISALWGDNLTKKEIRNHVTTLSRKFDKHNWNSFEIEKLIAFLKSEQIVVSDFLNSL